MKARDIISANRALATSIPLRNVPSEMPVVELVSRLLDTDDHLLGVTDGEALIGVIDAVSLLEGLNNLFPARDDSSIIILKSASSAYSASQIAHAVEDVDVHLLDLWTSPGSDGHLTITLKVQTSDPSGAVGSLERYGYEVMDAIGEENKNMDTAIERLLSLKTLLNV